MNKLNYAESVSNIRNILKDYILKSNLKSLVIGVSGGIDSALVCAIAKPVVDEIGIPLIGRSISIQTNKPDEQERARNIGKYFCTDFAEVDLTSKFLTLSDLDDMEKNIINNDDFAYKIRMGNIKARMRMIYLYNLASKSGGMVLGTENLCEHYLGFCTRGGDEISDFEPIKSLWKFEVYDMAEYLANNSDIEQKMALTACIECNATDGLGISNTDLDQILPDWKNRHKNTRTGYKEVDNIFIDYFETIDTYNNTYPITTDLIEKVSKIIQSPVIQRYLKSEHKRRGAFVINRENLK